MSHGILSQLVGIFTVGILAQWIAWKLRFPSILLLLGAGVVAGPATGLLHPDETFGELLLPMVSLSVAVILYEGGLTLRFRELTKNEISGVVLRMATISVLVSWLIGTLAARYILGFPWTVATLLGAILVVTGPTVIGPMLRDLRLRGATGALLKWEGIVVDPLGAILAVLVFTFVRSTEIRDGATTALIGLGMTFVIGISLGGLAAGVLILVLRRFWVPDYLHNAVSLMLMFVSFGVANALQHESGLLAVTIMGCVMANQKWVSIQHVVEFKETLTVLLISCLFIALSARLEPEELRSIGWESLLFVGVMIVIARPLSIFAATAGTSLPWRERVFLAWMAPRGIVAAAVASVFALELVAAGYENAIELVPITLLVVFATVLVYGLSARRLGQRLELIHTNPQGVLFVGAHSWARAIAKALQNEGYAVFLVDTDWENVRAARMAGLPCQYGSALAEKTGEEIDFGGLARMFAVTANNEVNSLACLHFLEHFGRNEVYQLPFDESQGGRHEVVGSEFHGRFLFGNELSYARLRDAFGSQPTVKKTKLTTEFDYQAFKTEHGSSAIILFVIKPSGVVQTIAVDEHLNPGPGDMILSIVGDLKQATSSQRVEE